MSGEDSSNQRGSVWSQFHSPVLENATIVDFKQMNPQDNARQVEIRKVRQSIEEMSVLLAEMQEMYHIPDSVSSAGEGSSPSEAYITAFDQTNSSSSPTDQNMAGRKPSLAFGMLNENPRNSNATHIEYLEGSQRKPRIDTSKARESIQASVVNSTATPNTNDAPHSGRSVSSKDQSRRRPDSSQPERSPDRIPQRSPHKAVSQPQVFSHRSNQAYEYGNESRQHHHPKGHALSHAQQTKRSSGKSGKSDKSGRPGHSQSQSQSHSRSHSHSHSHSASHSNPDARRSSARAHFTQQTIEQQLNNTDDLSIEKLNLPSSERKLLERFITALSKLSIEVQMDEAKRQEGRRRMNNALRALEGWI